MSDEPLILRTLSSVRDVDAEVWDAMASEAPPFLEWGFLEALEHAACTTGETGWLPQHVVLERDGAIIAALPMYLKGHSMGEFVFDHEWSYAAQRMGLSYYPKAIVAAPFTPVSGPRMLIQPELRGEPDLAHTLGAAAWRAAEGLELSGLHWLFITEGEAEILEEVGYSTRYGIQYHWHNEGFDSFDDWLSDFKSKKRRNIRRERRKIAEEVSLEVIEGEDLTPDIMRTAYEFYLSTIDKKAWGRQYLNERFYERLADRFAHRITVLLADSGGEAVGGALLLNKDGKLYGRYWGCREEIPYLHFEVCYYKPVELCIERGWSLFEAGAQGVHKYKRGFEPVRTYSAHKLRDPRFDAAVQRHLELERRAVDDELQRMLTNSPSRRIQAKADEAD